MGRLGETISKAVDFISTVKKADSNTIGAYSNMPRISEGPRSRLLKIVRNGPGECLQENLIDDYTGFPLNASKPYIDDMVESGVLERRQIERAKSGEVVDLICISDIMNINPSTIQSKS